MQVFIVSFSSLSAVPLIQFPDLSQSKIGHGIVENSPLPLVALDANTPAMLKPRFAHQIIDLDADLPHTKYST